MSLGCAHGVCSCPREGFAINEAGECVPFEQCPGLFFKLNFIAYLDLCCIIIFFLGYAPECPVNEVYSDCNRGYEPFCCNESFNQIEAGQMAQLPF